MGFLREMAPAAEPWSVTELTRYIRDLFEIDFRLQDVEVSGEISNFTQARSGHLYFTLKDENAQLKCVMWRSAAERLRFSPQDGDAVVANGRISVYEASGVYQLYAQRLAPLGQGDLALAFEQLKQRLAAEGLFEEAHKQSIPAFPRRIGIVTSADAAALRDILNVLQRRFPLASVLVAPTLVQGRDAPPQIVRALQWLDGRDDIDTIIVARGGGSMEDLWAFNDEAVARAIFAARHPVISGVGHETDFTIADFVADLRAPTPSAAAELAVPDVADLQAGLLAWQQRLVTGIWDRLARRQELLQTAVRTLAYFNPRQQVNNNQQRLDMFSMQLEAHMWQRLERSAARLAVMQSTLRGVSPLGTLARGYAIVRDSQGHVVRSVQTAVTGEPISIQVADGTFAATVADKEEI